MEGNLERLEKLAEWRGKVSATLETMSSALKELERTYSAFVKENSNELSEIRQSFRNGLEAIVKELREEAADARETQASKSKEIKEKFEKEIVATRDQISAMDVRITNLYIKVAGISATTGVITWILANVVLKGIFGL